MSNTKLTLRAPFLGIRPDSPTRQSVSAGSNTLYPPPAAQAAKQAYSTDQLFGSTNEIEIMHRGEIYQLRITRQEKLILTK